MIKVIFTNKAPAAVGPYSQAIVSNGFVFCAGQIGVDPKSGKLLEGFENQTKQTLKNVKAVVTAAGSSLNKIVKTTVYLKNLADYPKFNELYGKFMGNHKPARATVEVSNLPKNCLIEIDAIATL